MTGTILITGGAGFIGSHVADELLARGYHVRVLDNLSSQVHGPNCERPEYLDREVELIVGDVRNEELLSRTLKGIHAVFHFASRVGVGQSMYEVSSYTSVNNGGTATLLQALIQKPVQRLIVASSMSLYGEGLYRTADGQLIPGHERTLDQLKARDWELHDAQGAPLIPVPTPESKPAVLASIYALSKFDQERMCLLVGRSYQIPVVSLRFFNVYGPRQALSNPYTGVMAIFASRLLNGNPPMIFEDGLQQRDFVNVQDVACACRLALETPHAAGHVFNVGSGRSYTIRELAEGIARIMGKGFLDPDVTGKYRVGDVRHCFADIRLAREILGYTPRIELENGLGALVEWLQGQVAEDRVDQARAELSLRGLTV